MTYPDRSARRTNQIGKVAEDNLPDAKSSVPRSASGSEPAGFENALPAALLLRNVAQMPNDTPSASTEQERRGSDDAAPGQSPWRPQDQPTTSELLKAALEGPIDEPDRWPLPVRAGIVVGGGALLWLGLALALS